MVEYSRQELLGAHQVVSSTISKCEKIRPKFAEGTSQHTLLKNRIKAMYISKALITEDREIEIYSKEELIDALRPIVSVISKCEAGQKKHEMEALQYKRFQKIIDAMNIAKTLITDEIGKRG
ncbi:hypothetical protein [Desulfosporosinus sp. FKB]|uniref:hypothetical protein n=1 Tax=Desulfosporosinus sp. FKB TaxID=1969835 RepID=UPI000B4A00BF|nr:hypothetical protein [Desulfosporosinus sp. FKB]